MHIAGFRVGKSTTTINSDLIKWEGLFHTDSMGGNTPITTMHRSKENDVMVTGSKPQSKIIVLDQSNDTKDATGRYAIEYSAITLYPRRKSLMN